MKYLRLFDDTNTPIVTADNLQTLMMVFANSYASVYDELKLDVPNLTLTFKGKNYSWEEVEING